MKGNELNITIIPGIEIDCLHKDCSLHLLGYNIDHRDKRFDALEQSVLSQEQNLSPVLLDKAKEFGFVIDQMSIRKLSHNGIITGEMIAEAALTDSRNDNNQQLLPYRTGGNRSDNPYVNFYWDFCSAGKPLHIEITYISLLQAVKLIKDTDGVPILAHPFNNIGLDETFFEEIIAAGVEGVEQYCSYHDHIAVEHYGKLAQKFNLITTAGSDFHGKTKPAVTIGGHSFTASPF